MVQRHVGRRGHVLPVEPRLHRSARRLRQRLRHRAGRRAPPRQAPALAPRPLIRRLRRPLHHHQPRPLLPLLRRAQAPALALPAGARRRPAGVDARRRPPAPGDDGPRGDAGRPGLRPRPELRARGRCRRLRGVPRRGGEWGDCAADAVVPARVPQGVHRPVAVCRRGVLSEVVVTVDAATNGPA
jgi:hypothetical protein